MKFRTILLALPLALPLLTGCGVDESNGEDAPAATNGHAFYLGDIGMRGMEWRGEATLLEAGLEFADASLDMSTIRFSLNADHRDMTEFDNPPLEFRGEPVTLALRIGGLVQDREPGRIMVEINSVRPSFSGGPGTASTEELIEDLAANGVVLPEIDRDNPPVVTFEVMAADEDNREITLSADVDWIGSIRMRDGERAAL
ncbi:hypothetical protein IC757_01040 [Wenzhouxiangella sp. AB-CW3]|uniref:hypothetical protein n=1 Tax=Wenzhouxiangella sp. AB-CW3 TaxID=2771012 RepID=UPI00168B6540|nr:hypothetical protein [Wenzhouxiangella sp. AB-CW3]QOC22783.1 hypothetical protein IC757_01040 [Wenzhouxiangella sp. AB-CW3]